MVKNLCLVVPLYVILEHVKLITTYISKYIYKSSHKMTHLHSDRIDTLPLFRSQEMHGLRATNAMLSERVQAAVKRATDTSEAYKVSDWSVCGMHIDPNSVSFLPLQC